MNSESKSNVKTFLIKMVSRVRAKTLRKLNLGFGMKWKGIQIYMMMKCNKFSNFHQNFVFKSNLIFHFNFRWEFGNLAGWKLSRRISKFWKCKHPNLKRGGSRALQFHQGRAGWKWGSWSVRKTTEIWWKWGSHGPISHPVRSPSPGKKSRRKGRLRWVKNCQDIKWKLAGVICLSFLERKFSSLMIFLRQFLYHIFPLNKKMSKALYETCFH